jgi:hypothetical protein
VEAARWQVFAKAIWPADLAASLAADPLPDDPAKAKAMMQRNRMAGKKLLRELRELLNPPDEEPTGG